MRPRRGSGLLAATLDLLLGCVTAGWGPAGHRCVSSHDAHVDGDSATRITKETRDDSPGGPCLGCLLSGQLRASALPCAIVVVASRALAPIVRELPALLLGAPRPSRTARAAPLPLQLSPAASRGRCSTTRAATRPSAPSSSCCR